MTEKKKSSTAIAKQEETVLSPLEQQTLEYWRDTPYEEIKKMYGKGATDGEFEIFMLTGRTLNASPVMGEIYLAVIPGHPAAIIVGRNLYRRRAQEQSDFMGQFADAHYSKDKFRVVNGIPEHEYCEGEDRGTLKGAYSLTYHKKRTQPAYVYAKLNEYNRPTSKAWKRPHTMIVKVASAQGYREAFSPFFGPTYDESEDWTKEQNPDNVKLDDKMEVSTEKIRAHEDTGFEKPAENIDKTTGEILEIEKEELTENKKAVEEISRATGVDLKEKKSPPDGTKIVQEKMIDDQLQNEETPSSDQESHAEAPPLLDDDAPPEKNSGNGEPVNAEALKQKKINYARLLIAQCGNSQAKAQKLLLERTGVESWTQVTDDMFPIIDELLSDLANPNR